MCIQQGSSFLRNFRKRQGMSNCQTHPQSTCGFLSAVVTHLRTTLTQPVQHLMTQTQTTPATSTSSTSVPRETSPATSPEVLQTKTFPSSSSLPVTSASSASSLSSTQLGTSYPGKLPPALLAALPASSSSHPSLQSSMSHKGFSFGTHSQLPLLLPRDASRCWA